MGRLSEETAAPRPHATPHARVGAFDRALYPFAAHWHDRGGGIRMHYVDEGPADGGAGTALMVHGNPTWSFYYRNLIKDLSATHRCIAPDHVGMGLSDKPADSAYAYRLKDRVADLGGLMEALQVRRPLTLVVHDWGGMIGIAWALQTLALPIDRLAILNTAAFPLPAGRDLPPALWLTRTPLGALLVRGANAFAAGAARFCMTRGPMTPAVRDGYLAPYCDWDSRIATLRFVQDIPLRPGAPGFELVQRTAERLPSLQRLPLKIWWGGRDFVFDDHFLAEWKRRLPGVEVDYLADAGHYVLEDAAEVAPAVAAFAREMG